MSTERLGIAILGFGTVGRSVARIVCGGSHPNLRLTHIFNRGIGKKRVDVDWIPEDVMWTEDISDVCSAS